MHTCTFVLKFSSALKKMHKLVNGIFSVLKKSEGYLSKSDLHRPICSKISVLLGHTKVFTADALRCYSQNH